MGFLCHQVPGEWGLNFGIPQPMKSITIEWVSDITFAPIAKGIAKLSRIAFDWVPLPIEHQMQRLLEGGQAGAAHVLLVHSSRGYYMRTLKNGREGLDTFVNALQVAVARDDGPWVLINTLEVYAEGLVGLERMRSLALQYELNQRLVELSLQHPKLRLVETAGTLAQIGLQNALSPKSDLVMKLPYRRDAIDALAGTYVRVIEELFLPRKKVLALDADNTLWGGVLGEDGLAGIKIDPVSYPGAAFWRFQEQLKAAKQSGLVLALVSKNNDGDVLEAFEKVRMPLTLADFATRRVNWLTKSDNIQAIAAELNLGLESIVLIDDNIFELEQVRHALPKVDCYQFPSASPEDGLKLFASISDLTAWHLAAEDLVKSQLYADEALRAQARSASATLDDYLRSLELRVEYGVNRQSQLVRISQLTNKTNQFNLTTRRYTESDVEELMRQHKVYDFRVVDKYGDMGIVGVCIVKGRHIDTFLMSCRALGREVETTMLKVVCDREGTDGLTAEFIRSEKNQMVEKFYEKNGFELTKESSGARLFSAAGGPAPDCAVEVYEVV